MTLHRWHELECGEGNDFMSWTIARGYAPKREFYRDPETQAPQWRTVGEFMYDDAGHAYEERHVHSENKARYVRIPDRERGAQKRLAKIMARYPGSIAYVQGDPRGASLYIIGQPRLCHSTPTTIAASRFIGSAMPTHSIDYLNARRAALPDSS